MLISGMTSAAHYSNVVLCASARLGGGEREGAVAKGKGEVMRYVDVLGGKQLSTFKAKPSLMEGASGKQGRKCI